VKIEIEIEDSAAPAVASWITEQATRVANRATPLPGQSVGESAAVLRFANDVVGSVTQSLLDLAASRGGV